jgi:hypothetical protein
MARLTQPVKIKMILESVVRSTCCPLGRPSIKSLLNWVAPALAPRAREDALKHGTSNTSDEWKILSMPMLGYLGVLGSAMQALDLDDMYEELLMDEEDFVAARQCAPAHTDGHSDAPNTK